MKNTKRVTGRRQLHFNSLDDILADAEQLTSGPIKAAGNWSPGQIFEHLARGYTLPLDGVVLPIPFYVRWGARMMLGIFLRNGMPAGIKLDGESAQALVPPDSITPQTGLADLRQGVALWKAKTSVPRHSVFGNISDDQWTQVHLRHAELHMSFLSPE